MHKLTRIDEELPNDGSDDDEDGGDNEDNEDGNKDGNDHECNADGVDVHVCKGNEECLERDTLTGVCIAVGQEVHNSQIDRPLDEFDRTPDSDSDEENYVRMYYMHGTSMSYRKCGQSFMSLQAVRKHFFMCKVPTRSKLLVDRAVRHPYFLMETNELTVITNANQNPYLELMTVTVEVRKAVKLM